MQFDVAITSYKRPAMVRDAVASCLNQGPLLGKVVVVDDASGDDTAEVIRALNDPRIVFFQRQENGGIAAARRDAFALSDADWTVSIDSDHELLPGALQELARFSSSQTEQVGILGARYRWDTGGISPVNVPAGAIGYRERIVLSSQKDNIGSDYLSAISRRVREAVHWEPLRTILPDTLFQLDIAKIADAVFSPKLLALQKSVSPHSWTRASAEQRWRRRSEESADGVKAVRLILERHGEALKRWGRSRLADLYRQGAFYAVLNGQRVQAWRWLVKSVGLAPFSAHTVGVAVLSLLPKFIAKRIYLLRG